jgi:hypothetical protein
MQSEECGMWNVECTLENLTIATPKELMGL